MVASRQVGIPFYRGFGRQRWKEVGTPAQFSERTSAPCLSKYMLPASKRVGADLLEFAAPEIAEVVSGRKKFKPAARSMGRQTLRKKLRSGSKKRTANNINPTNTGKRPVSREESFLQTFLKNHFEIFSVPTFCGRFWKTWRENHSSWRCLVNTRTRNLS